MDMTIGGAADFNAAAAREGWHSICDPTLQFSHPELVKLLELWRVHAGDGGIPFRREMSARMLKSVLRDVAIYERIAPSEGARRYRVRLMGTGFAHIVGDLTGKFIDESVAAEFVPRWHAALDATLGAHAPLRFIGREDSNRMSFLTGEFFSAPLMADDSQVNLVLGSARYSGKHSWPEVEAETRQALGLG
jgi:hypothetical protein